jgi:hypothetical protein
LKRYRPSEWARYVAKPSHAMPGQVDVFWNIVALSTFPM